jgi:hypothetical protein
MPAKDIIVTGASACSIEAGTEWVEYRRKLSPEMAGSRTPLLK